MRYVNARNTAYGEDRRTYKETDSGVSSTQRVFNVSYDNGRVEAYLNGVRLFPDEDYTKTSSGIGASITLASDLGSNNVLEVVGYQGINSGNALVEDNFIVGTDSTGSGGAYDGTSGTNSAWDDTFPVASSQGDTVSVWRNGIKLVPTTDYTVNPSTSTVYLVSPAVTGDEITVQVVGGVIHNNGLTVNSGNDSFFLPTTRGDNNYVLTRDNSVGTGGTAWKETILTPTITSITYPTQNGVQATALAATGAQDTTAETLLINGQNLGTASVVPTVQIQVSGSYVTFAGTVSCNASGTVVTCANVTKQASADNYTLRLTHGGNNQIASTTVNFSADPSFSTASGSLGTVITGTAMSTRTITAGSSVDWYEGTPTMPTWMSHFADGATGTSQNLAGVPTIGSGNSEVQNFNIIIRDSENQSHNRDFSLTVNTAPTGGTIASSPPTGYRVHVWSTVGTNQGGQFTLYGTTLCDILVIAGGGGAGNGSGPGEGEGGGGGAGGLVYYHQKSLSAGSYDIIVGDKGTGSTGPAARGNSGNNSRFGSLTEAAGGGGGGSRNSSVQNGLDGGSGGGGGQRDSNTNNHGSVSVANQGNNGGNGFEGSQMSGGGGGGARTVGSSAPSTGVGGAGGYGYTEGDGYSVYNFTTSSALSSGIPANFQGTGSNQQYAGGGGGGGQSTPANGNNGGGNGATNQDSGTDATTYGSGGGGQGGDGKQGIVIVRYAI